MSVKFKMQIETTNSNNTSNIEVISEFTENQAKEYFNLDISRVSTSDPWVSFNNSLKLFYYENFYSELEKLS